MVIKLSKQAMFRIKDPSTLYATMVRDVDLLYQAPAFTSCATLIVCFIDALAAGNGPASKKAFIDFVQTRFPVLCNELAAAVPGKPGGLTFYEEFRNGLAHVRGPRSGFALARDTETNARFIEVFDVDGHGRYVGVNLDRLRAEFVIVVRALGGI